MKKLLIGLFLFAVGNAGEVIIDNPDIEHDKDRDPLRTEHIGDYDGDGTGDILLLTGYGNNTGHTVYRVTVYSYNKKQVVLSVGDIEGTYTLADAVTAADLDGDNTVEIIFGTRIFSYDGGNPSSKK